MALGDSIVVTIMVGAGKVEKEEVKAEMAGGMVELDTADWTTRDGRIVPAGLIYVTSYTRKGAKVTRLVVSQQAFVAAVERKRR